VNDFEPVVFRTYPVLREIKVALAEAGADLALLSGSGATMFGIFHDYRLAARAQETFGRDRRHKVYLVETCRQEPTCILE
jgi:4-diphosphocytidyl-2-C-methyl-D-erythritol kinase